MKKSFYYALTCLVLLLAAPLASCGSDDDDVVEQNNARTFVYLADVPEETLDLFDVTLTLYHGTKTKEVKLLASQGEPVVGKDCNLLHYFYGGFDGMEGIDSVKSVCAAKADIQSRLEAMDPDRKLYFGANTSMPRYQNGKPLETGSNNSTETGFFTFRASELLKPYTDGQLLYENLAGRLHVKFNAKPASANF